MVILAELHRRKVNATKRAAGFDPEAPCPGRDRAGDRTVWAADENSSLLKLDLRESRPRSISRLQLPIDRSFLDEGCLDSYSAGAPILDCDGRLTNLGPVVR